MVGTGEFHPFLSGWDWGSRPDIFGVIKLVEGCLSFVLLGRRFGVTRRFGAMTIGLFGALYRS